MSRLWKAAIAVAALAVVVAIVLVDLPDLDLEKALEDFARGLGEWTYLFVGVMAFLETGAFVGLVAPGEISIILGGAVAGQGEVDLFLLIGVAWSCALMGDSVSFLLGRKLGRGFVLKHGPRVRVTRERFAHVEDYFERHGGKTIVIGRALGWVRTLAPFIAGTSAMRYRVFLPFSILGTGIWASAAALLGYVFSRNVDRAANLAGTGSVLFGALVALIVGVIVLRKILSTAESRARAAEFMEARWGLRQLLALLRRIEPQLRFAWGRVTPGGLGLEFTTLLAALAVALYVVVAYTAILSGDPSPTAGDLRARQTVGGLRTAPLTDVARALAVLGQAAPVLAVAGATGLWLAFRRRWAEVIVLVAGIALTAAGLGLLGTIERSVPLDVTFVQPYPAEHAARSVVYAWLAVTVAFRVMPNLALRSTVVAVGFALAAAVGLARVYLLDDWLSDVAVGWALGASAFAFAAAVAVVVEHLRNNAGGDRSRSGG